MTSQQDRFAKYPREMRSSTQRPSVVYTRLPDHYALVYQQHTEAPSSEGVITTMHEDGGKIEVFRAEAEDERKRAPSLGEIRPVYALEPGGTLAVPTGQVFIRFKEGIQVKERLREIQQAGYDIAQTPGYAPHAAWLRAGSREIADALAGIQALEKIADIENVEPQMLMQRANRSMRGGGKGGPIDAL
jgi:hypothetical protein